MTNRERYKIRTAIHAAEARYATKSGGTTTAKMSMGEVAKIMGISRQAVHQLERSAFYKIRMALLPVLKEINPELYEQIKLSQSFHDNGKTQTTRHQQNSQA